MAIIDKERQGMRLENITYTLTDALNSFVSDHADNLRKRGFNFKYERKQKFNELAKHLKIAEKLSRELAHDMYKSEIVDYATYESDFIYYFIMLIMDRLYGNKEAMQRIITSILEEPSQGVFEVKLSDFAYYGDKDNTK